MTFDKLLKSQKKKRLKNYFIKGKILYCGA